MPSFRKWLIRNKLAHRSPVGDFARDVVDDRATVSLPNRREAWLKYLDGKSCEEAREAFKMSWAEYAEKKERGSL